MNSSSSSSVSQISSAISRDSSAARTRVLIAFAAVYILWGSTYFFIRIGVGVVRKPEEKAYRPYDTYEIVDPGKWTIHKHKDRVEFTQHLTSEDGYAYVYRKTVRLVKGKPQPPMPFAPPP